MQLAWLLRAEVPKDPVASPLDLAPFEDRSLSYRMTYDWHAYLIEGHANIGDRVRMPNPHIYSWYHLAQL